MDNIKKNFAWFGGLKMKARLIYWPTPINQPVQSNNGPLLPTKKPSEKTKQLHKKHETLNMNTSKANFLPNH